MTRRRSASGKPRVLRRLRAAFQISLTMRTAAPAQRVTVPRSWWYGSFAMAPSEPLPVRHNILPRAGGTWPHGRWAHQRIGLATSPAHL